VSEVVEVDSGRFWERVRSV